MHRPLVSLALAAVASLPLGAQSIGIGSGAPPATTSTASLGVFGDRTNSLAQTFLPPTSAPVLTSMRFWFSQPSLTPTTFRVFVYAWNDATLRLDGPALWESAATTGPAAAGSFSLEFTPAALLLEGGRRYAFVLTGLLDQPVDPTVNTGTSVRFAINDLYADGALLLSTVARGAPRALLESGAWTSATSPGFPPDLYFTATFTQVVPEPATFGLLAGGLGVLGLAARRRIRSRSA